MDIPTDAVKKIKEILKNEVINLNEKGITVKPASLKEVIKIVKLCNKFKIPINPLSSGMNWGYGYIEPRHNSILMDLSGLNRIIEVNENLAYVRVQPGVTFNQLFYYLKKKASNLMIEMTGASPDSSLISSVIERGLGRGFNPKRNENICNLEVVLPNGKVIRTGFGQFNNSLSQNVFREGIGPDFTGIFLQSNLGIVTEITIWLSPAPPLINIFSFFIKNSNELPFVLDTFRELKYKEVLKKSCFLSNDYKLIAYRQQYPFNKMNGRTPLSYRVLNKLKKKWGIKGKWYAEGLLGSFNNSDFENKKKIIKKALGNYAKNLKFSESLPGNMLYHLNNNKSILPTNPSYYALPSMYWRKNEPIPSDMNPERDNCGIIWVGPVVPLDGEIIDLVLKKIKKIIRKYEFEPNIGINLATERAVYIIIAILFDRSNKNEYKNASNCYFEILSELEKIGIYPYRLTADSMDFFEPDNNFKWLLKSLKKKLDPNDIISRGRYDFRKLRQSKV